MNKKRIACIVGARPNFMKIAPLLAEMSRRPGLEGVLIHTEQHSSPEMSDTFFEELGSPRPTVLLGVSGGSSNEQTAKTMLALEPVFRGRRPDLVLVVGDVNATVASAMVAAKEGIRIAHVEAGLRSFDRAMPEEINRVVTDSLSDFLFTTEPSGRENLLREGVAPERIFFCGNVMIDTLLKFREKAARSNVLERLGVRAKNYITATLHRPSNVDSPARLRELIEMFDDLSARMPVVFPIHPRTRQQMKRSGLAPKKLVMTTPLGYLDFLKLMSESRVVITDSGGIQEETTILNVPCLTVRENTERPVTITGGTNRLVGVRAEAVRQAAEEALAAPYPAPRSPELWDGKAAARVVDVLERVV